MDEHQIYQMNQKDQLKAQMEDEGRRIKAEADMVSYIDNLPDLSKDTFRRRRYEVYKDSLRYYYMDYAKHHPSPLSFAYWQTRFRKKLGLTVEEVEKSGKERPIIPAVTMPGSNLISGQGPNANTGDFSFVGSLDQQIMAAHF